MFMNGIGIEVVGAYIWLSYAVIRESPMGGKFSDSRPWRVASDGEYP